ARRIPLEEVRTRLQAAVSTPDGAMYLRRLTQADKLRPLLGRPLELTWSAEVQVLSDPPEKAHLLGSRQQAGQWLIHSLTPLLQQAQSEVLVISPYFVPGVTGCARLTALAEKGIDTRVLTNSLEARDVALVHAGYS